MLVAPCTRSAGVQAAAHRQSPIRRGSSCASEVMWRGYRVAWIYKGKRDDVTVMSTAPDWVTLTPDEAVVWQGRPTLHAYLGQIFPGVILLAFGVAIAGVSSGGGEIAGIELGQAGVLIGGILLAVGLFGILRPLLTWWSIVYLITTEEVYKKHGLVSRTVTNVRLDQIQNTSFRQSVLGRLLSYGSVHIDTAGSGGTEVVFESVPKPQTVVGILTEQLDAVPTR